MGSFAPSSSSFPVSSSPSLLLPKLTPAVDEWFISTTSDLILTQALTHELSSSTSASTSSSSAASNSRPPSWELSESSAFLQSKNCDGFLPQVGSPVSSGSICKEMPESPLNCVAGMSNISMPNLSSTTESFLAQNYKEGKFHQLDNMSILKTATLTPSSINPLFSSQAPSPALSSQASAGAGIAKVSKRRSRTNKKAPIAILSADTSNFRAMVQQLTGIPTSHAPSPFWGTSGVPLLKPPPTKLPYNGGSLDLPTLDTSASFLGPKITTSTQNFSFFQQGTSQQSGPQPFSGSLPPNNRAELAYFHERSKSFLGNSYKPNTTNYEASLPSSASSLPVLLDAMESGKLSGNFTRGSLRQLLGSNITRAGDQSSISTQSSNPFESSLVFDEDLHAKPSYNTVDSWLTFDGGALATNHSPRIDLAKVVS